MKKIELACSGIALVDDSDFELLNKFNWHACPGKYTLYAITRISGNKILMHSLLFSSWEMIDHKDGNGLNNQRENLRKCSQTQNNANMKIRKNKLKSKFKGVSHYRDGRWRASIQYMGYARHLGYFISEILAAKAYNEAALKTFGEFARLNEFPPQGQVQ